MNLETKRLNITEFNVGMARNVHLNSLDEDTRRFLPDEVFETEEEALETIEYLMTKYSSEEGPFVYPCLLKTGENIGYVQLIKMKDFWGIGFHIAKQYTNQGYASEAVMAFLPYIMNTLGLSSVHGICLADNMASCRVLEKCGFKKYFDGLGTYQDNTRLLCKYEFKSLTNNE